VDQLVHVAEVETLDVGRPRLRGERLVLLRQLVLVLLDERRDLPQARHVRPRAAERREIGARVRAEIPVPPTQRLPGERTVDQILLETLPSKPLPGSLRQDDPLSHDPFPLAPIHSFSA